MPGETIDSTSDCAINLLDNPNSSNPQEKQIEAINTIATYYHRYYNGGVEAVISEQLKLWVEMGYQVVLITDEEPHPLDCPTPDTVIREVIGSFDPEDCTQRALRIAEIARAYKIDVLVYHAWLTAALEHDTALAKSLGISVVVQLHGSSVFWLTFPEILYKDKYRFCDCILTLSQADQSYWDLYYDNTMLAVNPLRITPDSTAKNQAERFDLLWVGRLEFFKNYKDLFPMLSLVKAQYPEVLLKVVGGTFYAVEEEMAEVQAEIDAWELTDNIKLCGFQKDMPPYYSSASIYVVTSKTEGFPLSVLESKAFGLPCVAYDLPEVEMFREGEGMLLVKQGDYTSMAEHIISLLADESMRETLGAAAKRSAQKYLDFDQKAFWHAVLDSLSSDGKRKAKPVDPESLRILIERILAVTQDNEILLKEEINNLRHFSRYHDERGLRAVVRLYDSKAGKALTGLARRIYRLFHRTRS
jgi:glycosyltransferase involved in cell wall biosynthesis